MILSSKEKAFIYTVALYEYGLDLNIIKGIAIADVNIKELQRLELIDIDSVDDTPVSVRLTEKGLKIINEKHVVLYSLGKNFDDFIKTLTANAKIKFFHSLLDNEFFSLRYGTFIKTRFVETFINNDFVNNPLLPNSTMIALHNYVASHTNLNMMTLYNYIKIYSDSIYTALYTKCVEIDNAVLDGLSLTDDSLTGFKMLDVVEIKNGTLVFKYNNNLTTNYSISVHQAYTIYNFVKSMGKNGVLIL